MKLFESVHRDVFTVLSSPNRELYADALGVLYEAYQDHLKIPETVLYSMLRGKLERQLAEASFEGEDIDEEELRDVSGRARFLVRKLGSRGWFEKERGKDFEENIIVPGYSSQLLELFHELTSDEVTHGFSYVFDTYSSLKIAKDEAGAYEKMVSVYSAYENTHALIKLLKKVYHNVKSYFQLQIEIQDINKVLSSHFDDFGLKVVETYIRPLKIRDSVPKYRVPIQSILDEWLEDDVMLLAMSNAALQDKRNATIELCRAQLLEMMFWIKTQYERVESEYLDEIDSQVRRYTRATTQKIESLTNRDQNTKGNLIYVLSALSENRKSAKLVDAVQSAFHLYEQGFLSEKSLWHRKQAAKRVKNAPIAVFEDQISDDAKDEAKKLLSSKYSKMAVSDYLRETFGEESVLYTKDIDIVDDHDYLMNMFALIHGFDRDSFYKTEILEGTFSREPYIVPQLKFTTKE